MYQHKTRYSKGTSLKVNTSYIGETIEQKINRIVNNKEPITDGAPLIYTDRRDGVKPETDIRTDRFEIAIEAMDHVDKAHKAKREQRLKTKEDDKKSPGVEDGGPKSTAGTNETPTK